MEAKTEGNERGKICNDRKKERKKVVKIQRYKSKNESKKM